MKKDTKKILLTILKILTIGFINNRIDHLDDTGK